MLKKYIPLIVFFVLSVAGTTHAQSHVQNLEWKQIDGAMLTFSPNASGLYFEDCVIDEESGLPVSGSRYTLNGNYRNYEASISDEVYVPLSDEEMAMFPIFAQPDTSIVFLKQELTYIRKKPAMYVSFMPFRTNPVSGKIEKLVSFRIGFIGYGTPLKSSQEYASQSVLATGNWLKFSTSGHGVHKVTYEELANAGFSFQGVYPNQIRLFGNGGAMLPEQNDLPRADDLKEIAVEVVSVSPDEFIQGDYILFYAPSPDTWQALTSAGNLRFEFNKNLYSDKAWYFVTVSDEPGKRIESLQPVIQPATHQVNTFHDYGIYKPDEVNLAKVGRQWFGDKTFGNSPLLELPAFHFPNIDSTYRVLVRSRFAVKASEVSRVKLHVNEHQFLGSLVTVPNTHVYANLSAITATFNTSNPLLEVAVDFMNTNPSAAAWVDFIEVNLKRHLVYTEGQFSFRDLSTVGNNYVGNFRLRNPSEGLVVWEVTDISEPRQIEYAMVNDILEFRLPTSALREFIAFAHEDAYPIQNIEVVQNQNLHGLEAHDMIIVSPEVFLQEAEHYAQLRRASSELSIQVVMLEQIYNEFASGSADPTAIRDFMKMLYDRAPEGNEPRYLLLFGDGSYDPKDRLGDNQNFIPTYQSVESLRLDATYVTDDYYGLLDDGEGLAAAGGLDIGIGRFPINSIEQAAILHDKADHYLLNLQETSGSWRNTVSIIAHDEDNDVHFVQAEELANYIDTNHSVYSLEKIYLDAYQRSYVPSGYRYPEVNAAINQRVDEGALLINYIGHGGETGWAHSKVLTVSDISSWNNRNNMPVFITATCSFGRFDNPELVSAGEMVVLNPNGGGIALFTTSRLAYSSFNFRLNKSYTRFFFERPDGRINSLGDVMMQAKNDNENNLFIRNQVLLGDPSLKAALPSYNIVTTSINGVDVEDSASLYGMSTVSISGYIEDYQQNKMSGFNGILKPVVYDKAIKYYTNANHSSSTKRPFNVQNTVLYQGQVSVVDGEFTFSFVVPRDVNPAMGPGKISYYASNGEVDANGSFDGFLIGGFDPLANDDTGPEIDMYINSPDFSFGGSTNNKPLLVARLQDESGINFFGLGIGHEIIAFLNEDTQNPILLNDYFEPDLDSHTSGTISYRFQNLPEGKHSLRLKAFDLNNNSSEAYTEFVVTSRLEIASGDLKNFPNPFATETWFEFKHNYYDQVVNVVIDIYDIAGQAVKTIGPRNVFSSGSVIEPIYWNGTNDSGNPLGSGVYIYQVRMQTENEFTSIMQGKLMIAR